MGIYFDVVSEKTTNMVWHVVDLNNTVPGLTHPPHIMLLNVPQTRVFNVPCTRVAIVCTAPMNSYLGHNLLLNEHCLVFFEHCETMF